MISCTNRVVSFHYCWRFPLGGIVKWHTRPADGAIPHASSKRWRRLLPSPLSCHPVSITCSNLWVGGRVLQARLTHQHPAQLPSRSRLLFLRSLRPGLLGVSSSSS